MCSKLNAIHVGLQAALSANVGTATQTMTHNIPCLDQSIFYLKLRKNAKDMQQNNIVQPAPSYYKLQWA